MVAYLYGPVDRIERSLVRLLCGNAAGRELRPGSIMLTQEGMVFRVHTLTPERFYEEVVRWIEPAKNGPRPHGMHTLSGAGNITVVDGKRERFIPVAARAALGREIHRTRAACRHRNDPDDARGRRLVGLRGGLTLGRNRLVIVFSSDA